jgi:hypothetical protein
VIDLRDSPEDLVCPFGESALSRVEKRMRSFVPERFTRFLVCPFGACCARLFLDLLMLSFYDRTDKSSRKNPKISIDNGREVNDNSNRYSKFK